MIFTNKSNIVSFVGLFLAVCTFKSTAQEMPKYELKSYVDESGRLYWPLKLPVYLFATPQDSKSDAHRLKSERSAPYTNPMFFGQEGLNKIVSKWAIDENGNYLEPMQDVVFKVWVDGTAPITKVKFLNAPSYRDYKTIWYGKNLSVQFSATDNLVGVDKIQVAEVGSPYMDYSNALTFTNEMEYTLQYYAVDHLGHASEVKSTTFGVDYTAPITSINAIGDLSGSILSPSTILKLYGRDFASKVKSTNYVIDNGNSSNYVNSISLKGIPEGEHTIYYQSADNVNNVEEKKKYDFYLDRTPPQVTSSILGEQYQNRGRVFVSTRTRVKLDAFDNKAGLSAVGYTINGGQNMVYIEPFNLPKKEGKYEIVFFAKDRVNNQYSEVFDESKHGRQALDMDLIAPEIGFDYVGSTYKNRDTVFITPSTKIKLLASDKDSGIKKIGYKLNQGAGLAFFEPFSVATEGPAKIDFYATDNINNRNFGDFNFVVDGTGPEIMVTPSMRPIDRVSIDNIPEEVPVFSKGVKIYLAATDDTIDTNAIYFTQNNQPEAVYAKPITLTAAGLTIIKVRATDQLGNETRTETLHYFVR